MTQSCFERFIQREICTKMKRAENKKNERVEGRGYGAKEKQENIDRSNSESQRLVVHYNLHCLSITSGPDKL